MFYNELKNELRPRWESVKKGMIAAGADGMLISSNVNLFYICGRVFSGFAFVPAQGDPLFFVRRPIGLSGERVIYIRKAEDIVGHLSDLGISPEAVMLEYDTITFNEYQRYAKIFAGCEIMNGSPVLNAARSIKTPYEIGLIRESALRQAKVYKRIPELYSPGMTDIGLSAEIEYLCRQEGSLGIFRIAGQSMEIFVGSVLAGDNADAPSPYDFALGGGGLDNSIPIGGNGTRLEQGMSVMVDFGANYTGYMADMSRVFAVGKLNDLAYKAHKVSIEICEALGRTAGPGTAAKELYEISAKMAAEAGLEDYFMGYSQKAGFVGHGVGIEINESPVLAPRSKDIMREGMVFALEPKFVIPGVGAVGIENTYAVTGSGVEKLTVCEEEILQLG